MQQSSTACYKTTTEKSNGFPAWDLYLDPGWIPGWFRGELRRKMWGLCWLVGNTLTAFPWVWLSAPPR